MLQSVDQSCMWKTQVLWTSQTGSLPFTMRLIIWTNTEVVRKSWIFRFAPLTLRSGHIFPCNTELSPILNIDRLKLRHLCVYSSIKNLPLLSVDMLGKLSSYLIKTFLLTFKLKKNTLFIESQHLLVLSCEAGFLFSLLLSLSAIASIWYAGFKWDLISMF